MVYASAMDDILGKLSRETTPTVQDRLLVCEMLPHLEAKNPTTNPAYSPYLDGEWELIYSGGVSPGPVPFPTRELSLLMYAGGFTPGMFLMSVSALSLASRNLSGNIPLCLTTDRASVSS
jgi:hypothetical protein